VNSIRMKNISMATRVHVRLRDIGTRNNQSTCLHQLCRREVDVEEYHECSSQVREGCRVYMLVDMAGR
jgi:hypothetical protein